MNPDQSSPVSTLRHPDLYNDLGQESFEYVDVELEQYLALSIQYSIRLICDMSLAVEMVRNRRM